MSLFLNVFSPVLLPLVLVAGAAYLLGHFSRLDPRPIARLTFYLFNPSLVFVALASSAVAPELLGRLALLKLLTYLTLIPLALGLTSRLRLSAPATSAFVLVAVSANSGNYGLPVNEYAFGAAGLALAVICYVTDNLAINSIGVYLAARGHANGREAFRQVLRNPALYAAPLGIAANQLGWAPPLPLERALELLSRAAVPTMLAVLGMQLAVLPLERRHWRLIGLASSLRLIVAPLLAMLYARPLGLTGLARQVGVLQAAAPTAVMTSIVAGRYDVEPNLVAGTILASSLASLVTVTALLSWMS
jgi:predicted permease